MTISTKQQVLSEPHCVLSTLYGLTHASLTTFLCAVATRIITPIS